MIYVTRFLIIRKDLNQNSRTLKFIAFRSFYSVRTSKESYEKYKVETEGAKAQFRSNLKFEVLS